MDKEKEGSISKEINLQGGSLRAQVTDQNRKNFTIESSVSVASVKGTDFWFINDNDNGQDFVHGLDGLIELTNKNSGISVDIEAGITGFSNIDGNLQIKKTDPKILPADEVDAETTEGTSTKPNNQPGMRTVNLFSTNVEIPIPETEILITATTTAVASVAAALSATAVFNWIVKIMKPVIKTTWKKIRGKKRTET